MSDPETDNLFHAIENEVMKDEHILQIHGFNLDKNTKTVVFDLIVGFDVKDRRAYFEKVVEKIEAHRSQDLDHASIADIPTIHSL